MNSRMRLVLGTVMLACAAVMMMASVSSGGMQMQSLQVAPSTDPDQLAPLPAPATDGMPAELGLSKQVISDDQQQFVRDVLAKQRPDLQAAAVDALEDVIRRTRTSVSTVFDEKLFQLKQAAYGEINQVAFLAEQMHTTADQILRRQFSSDTGLDDGSDSVGGAPAVSRRLLGADTLALRHIHHKVGTELSAMDGSLSADDNSATLSRTEAQFTRIIRHVQSKVDRKIGSKVLKRAIASVQTQMCAQFSADVKQTEQELDKDVYLARVATRELAKTHFAHADSVRGDVHQALLSYQTQQLDEEYDSAQNNLQGAKMKFADAVQTAEKDFLQSETVRLVRHTIRVTIHKLAADFEIILSKLKMRVDRSLNKLMGISRELYDKLPATAASSSAAASGDAESAPEAPADGGAAATVAPLSVPTLAPTAAADAAATPEAAPAGARRLLSADASTPDGSTVGRKISSVNQPVIDNAAQVAIDEVMTVTRHKVATKLESAVAQCKAALDSKLITVEQHILELQDVESAATVHTAALALTTLLAVFVAFLH